jgi:hypothetical protein
MTRHGVEELSEDLEVQRAFLTQSVPVYGRLLELLQQELDAGLRERLAALWAGRQFNSVYERPLVLLAALRFDALCEGAGHPLQRAIVSEPPSLEAVTREALRDALDATRTRLWQAIETRFVQTNESSRAVAWLWPAALLRSAAGWQSMALVDLGTSAGLNLVADALPMPWTRADGEPLLLEPRPAVTRRLGLDRSPLDVRDALTAQWLRACVWPGDSARQARLEQGIAVLRDWPAGPAAPAFTACDLRDALGVLRGLPAAEPVLAVQTIVRDYLPAEVRAQHEQNLRDWLGERPAGSALWVQLELEPGGSSMLDAAGLSVELRGRTGALERYLVARSHPHPSLLHVDSGAVNALVAAARS